jgi:hypothetical protein
MSRFIGLVTWKFTRAGGLRQFAWIRDFLWRKIRVRLPFASLMKYLLILAVYVAAIWGLSGCGSTGITSTSTGGGDPVPGEKVTGEERLGAGVTGTGSPNAQVKW